MFYPAAHPDFHTANRRNLAALLQDEPLIVIAGATSMQRSNDMAYRFEQSASMWYLSGIDEADWFLIIDSKSGKDTLLGPNRSDVRRIFDGGLSPEDAARTSGVSDILMSDDVLDILRQVVVTGRKVYALKPQDDVAKHAGFSVNPGESRLWEQLHELIDSENVHDVRPYMSQLRAIKQPYEIDMLQRAIDITTETLHDVFGDLSQKSTECGVEAAIGEGFRRRGASGHAYDPIVAAAKNACTLHYVSNNDRIKSGDVLLVDVGARYGGYCADITRSVIVGGAINDRAADVIASVKAVHDTAVGMIRPGVGIHDYHDSVMKAMGERLVALQLIDDPTDTDAVHTYFPHAVSHGLGLDVHDSLGAPLEFAAGMVLTVEPGIYIPEEGIGVRIENDILVTSDSQRNLSAALPNVLS